MRPITLSLFVFTVLLLPPVIYSQNTDSINFVSAKWTVSKIKPKVKLYNYQFNKKDLFGANENISYVEVKNGWCKKFFLAAEPKLLRATSDFATANNAIAAVNGNFFDVKNGGSVDLVKVDSKVINETQVPKSGVLARHQMAGVMMKRGKLSIKKWDGSLNWAEKLPEKNVLLNGPLLFLNNEFEKLDSGSFNTARHPRTCIGIRPGGRVIMLVVDGRNENSAGMSLFELTKIMKWLGCTGAINFDGGGSSTLWVKGRGVVNYPSDNKKWDHDGQRKVANILYVK